MKTITSVLTWMACLPFVLAGLILGFFGEAFVWGWEAGRTKASKWVEVTPDTEQP